MENKKERMWVRGEHMQSASEIEMANERISDERRYSLATTTAIVNFPYLLFMFSYSLDTVRAG